MKGLTTRLILLESTGLIFVSGLIGIPARANLNLKQERTTSVLPRPDANGDYTPDNADTWLTETAGFATWPQWRITSVDGEVNCREMPNGEIEMVYTSDRIIEAELRGVNAIQFDGTNPWMLTRKGCYVRANSQYIEPVPESEMLRDRR